MMRSTFLYILNCTMHKPELYIKSNRLAKNLAVYVLSKHASLLEDADNHAVIDVGCGPGNITFENILPLLPKTTKKLIGVDISPAQVEYARSHYGEDPTISYQVLDVTTDTLPEEFIGTFDLVLSLLLLHCVKDQRKAVTNLRKMLKSGGKLVMSCMKTTPFPEIYQLLYDNPKWTKYLSDYKSYFPNRSVQYYKDLLNGVGFDNVVIEEKDNVFSCSWNEAPDILSSINMFQIPENLMNDYLQDQINYFFKYGLVSIDQKQCRFPNTVLSISAVKL